MIALENVSLRAGTFGLEALHLTVPEGSCAVLLGRTGSGKTTLLEAIAGLRPIQVGRVSLLGKDVTHCRPAERAVGYVPQDLALFPTLTVREHLAFALAIRRWPAFAVEQRVEELADLLGLNSLLARLPHGLSGGESQRVALGRALSFRPQVLLLDEPISALDGQTHAEFVHLLKGVQKRLGVTTLHVTHNLTEARALADQVFLLERGILRPAPEVLG